MKLTANHTIKMRTAKDKESETHAPGDDFDAPDKIAKDLIGKNAAVKAGAGGGKAEDAGPTKPAGKKLTDAVVEAIGRIDRAAADGWNKDGAPSLHALIAMLGYDINAGDRDKAWEDFQAANTGPVRRNVLSR